MHPPNTLEVNGEAIRHERMLRGMNQTALARKLSITRPHLSRIELGRRPVSGPLFARIRAALDMTADELLASNGGLTRKGETHDQHVDECRERSRADVSQPS